MYTTLCSIPKMTIKKRDTSKKRESIIRAATAAFRDEGYDKASMDYIAQSAGASKRTVYNHFTSKKSLFQAVIDTAIGELSEHKQIPYDPALSLEEQIEKFADAKLATVQDPSWLSLTKVVFSVFIQEPELAQETIGKAKSGQDTLVSWLEAANRDGRMNIPDVEIAANIFWAMITGAFIWPMVLTGPMKTREITVMKQELIRTFLSRYSTGKSA